MATNSGGNGAMKPVSEKVIKEPLDLLTTENLGKALEIQSLLAREGIIASRKADGQKSIIYLKTTFNFPCLNSILNCINFRYTNTKVNRLHICC